MSKYQKQQQTRSELERISITIEPDLRAKLDRYVNLNKTAKKGLSRSNIICELIRIHIPTN